MLCLTDTIALRLTLNLIAALIEAETVASVTREAATVGENMMDKLAFIPPPTASNLDTATAPISAPTDAERAVLSATERAADLAMNAAELKFARSAVTFPFMLIDV